MQRLEVEELRPQGLLIGGALVENRWELEEFVLIGLAVAGHVLGHVANQVIRVPTGVNDRHPAAGHQTRTRTEREPLICLGESLVVTIQDVLFVVRVVHQQQVSTTTGQRGAHTAREILSASVRVPTSSAF